jgi:hypothetical protein
LTAYVVYPRGRHTAIDFDRVDIDLVSPALTAAGLEKHTYGNDAGNVRQSPIRMLYTCDVALIDVSSDDPHVFYQLGVRHALRAKHTILMAASHVQSDTSLIATGRVFLYDSSSPADAMDRLIAHLTHALSSSRSSSPVFMELGHLREPLP